MLVGNRIKYQPMLENVLSLPGGMLFLPIELHFTLHLSHLADALIQSDLQIGAFTL
jgi:hypothetical protein